MTTILLVVIVAYISWEKLASGQFRRIAMKKILLIIIALALTSCAGRELQLGNMAYNKGDYDVAATHWNPLAKKGNALAQYNVGLLWEHGLGNTPKDENAASQWFLLSAQQGHVLSMVRLARIQKIKKYNDAALSWFNLAARWGNQEARNELTAWGKAVPEPDLLVAQQQASTNSELTTLFFINSFLSGYLGTPSPSLPQVYTPPQQSHTKTYTAPPTYTAPQENSCSSDFGCNIGYKCEKPLLASYGVCTKALNSFGVMTYQTPRLESVGPNMDLNSCQKGYSYNPVIKICEEMTE